MARRPFDPADAGWKKTEYRQGDVRDPDSVRDAREGRRRGRPPGLRDPHGERRHARDQRGRLAHRVRGRGGRRREAHLLRVERRRLRVPRGQPGLAHRGRAAARHARALLLAAEGGGRAGARRGAARPQPHRGLRLPPLHRRRAARADAARGDPLLPAVGEAMPDAVRAPARRRCRC